MKTVEIANTVHKPKKLLGVRHLQVILLFLGLVISYSMRVSMSTAIVAMTDPNSYLHFDWSKQTQRLILASYFWGYILLQIPGGEMAERIGGRLLMIVCLSVNAIISLLLPLCAHYGGWEMVCICRVFQGLFQGLLYPSINTLLSKWVPLEEKSFLSSMIYSGAQLGTALQLAASGFLTDFLGWPAIFYANGVIGLMWTAVYLMLGASTPESIKFISYEERSYIQNSLGHVDGYQNLKTPWRLFFTSMPVFALIIASCGFHWGYWTLMMETPAYMSLILGVDIRTSGVMSALPHLAMYIMSFPFGFFSDYILKKKILSITAARKIFNSIGCFGPALIFIVLAYETASNVMLPIILLTLAVAMNAGIYTGFMTNPANWQHMFFISAVVYIGSNLFYVMFGSSDVQKWDEADRDTRISECGASIQEANKA